MYLTEKRLLKWALICNAIYVMLFFLVRPQGLNIKKVVIAFFLLFSVIAILLLSIKNIKKINQIPKFLRVLFYLLVVWGVITIIRGLSFSMQDLATNFGNVYMGWAWVLPMSLIIGLKIENWTIVFRVINFVFQLMLIVFLISLSLNNSYLQWAWLLRPVNFLLLVGLYRFSLINKIQIFIIIAVYIAVAIQVDQRMDLLYLSITIFFLLLDRLVSIKIKYFFIKYIIIGFIMLLIIIFTAGYEFVSDIVATVIDFQETRKFLFTELMSDLNFTEKFVGRGSLGTYYSEFFERVTKYYQLIGNTAWRGDDPIRITIEVGYLQMILKGGFILFALNFIFYILSSYKAIFKSNNKFTRSLGYYILIVSILSIVSMRPTFAPTFIILWMAIGTVLSKKFREMQDDEIEDLIKFK